MVKILTGIGKVNRCYRLGFILFFLNMLVACYSNIDANEVADVVNEKDKAIIFSMIIDHPDVQVYFHPDEKNRTPLKERSHEALGVDLLVMNFEKPVVFYLDIDFKRADPFLDVVLFSVSDNSASFNIVYSIEGVTLKGELKKRDNRWVFMVFDVFES